MSRTRTLALLLALPLFSLSVLFPLRAMADHDRGDRREGAYRRGDEWHAWDRGDIGDFGRRDFDGWREGRWWHGWYGQRFGWWWINAGIWYSYPAPVYPYPNPYVPSQIVITQPYPAPAATPGPPPTQYWYYCAAAQGYYPYVPSCPGGWEKVPATPPPGR
ncbi:MAG: hypothetical protein ACYDB9_09200 [Gammaproteobacteria bacterium]